MLHDWFAAYERVYCVAYVLVGLWFNGFCEVVIVRAYVGCWMIDCCDVWGVSFEFGRFGCCDCARVGWLRWIC